MNEYKHQLVENARCAVCGSHDRPLALGAIEYAQLPSQAAPAELHITVATAGRIRGSFPVCDQCAPPCPKCELPMMDGAAREYFDRLVVSYAQSAFVSLGMGVCRHVADE